MADLKLKDLRYLVAVADTRHFGQAAARCFVSQPTLSAQIKKLEDYLGVQLIERHPRRIALTEPGAQVVARARRIIEASDEIVTLAETRRDPLAGRLRMALLPTIGPYLLPQFIPLLQETTNKLSLYVEEGSVSDLAGKLRSGDLDALLVTAPFVEADVVTQPLFDEPFVVLLPADHRLAARVEITGQDLLPSELLLLGEGDTMREQILFYQDIYGTPLDPKERQKLVDALQAKIDAYQSAVNTARSQLLSQRAAMVTILDESSITSDMWVPIDTYSGWRGTQEFGGGSKDRAQQAANEHAETETNALAYSLDQNIAQTQLWSWMNPDNTTPIQAPSLVYLDGPYGSYQSSTAFSAVAGAGSSITRVVVMAARPGRVIEEISIGEPFPRENEFRVSPQFSRYAKRLQDDLLRASTVSLVDGAQR